MTDRADELRRWFPEPTDAGHDDEYPTDDLPLAWALLNKSCPEMQAIRDVLLALASRCEREWGNGRDPDDIAAWLDLLPPHVIAWVLEDS